MSFKFFLDEAQLEDILKRVGVRIAYHTGTDIICYCTFHDNRDSPAFNISKRSPYLWKCWNGKCNQQGNIYSLLTKKGYTGGEAKKLLLIGGYEVDNLRELIKSLVIEEQEETDEWDGIDPQRFRQEDQDHGYPARQYLMDRGISEKAYEHFRMGYSHKKRMLVIPVFTDRNKLAGVIGRSIEGKRYQYSNGLDRSGILWGLNSAINSGTDLILTEGALDAVRIWDSGYGCAAAILGSAISVQQWKLIRKYFGDITCFFDNDAAGNAVRDSILEKERKLLVSYVEYPERLVELDDGTKRPIKDPGELTDSEIRQMIINKRTSLELMLNG